MSLSITTVQVNTPLLQRFQDTLQAFNKTCYSVNPTPVPVGSGAFPISNFQKTMPNIIG